MSIITIQDQINQQYKPKSKSNIEFNKIGGMADIIKGLSVSSNTKTNCGTTAIFGHIINYDQESYLDLLTILKCIS